MLLSFVRVALPCYSLCAASHHDPLASPELPPRPTLLLGSSLLVADVSPPACAVVVVQLRRYTEASKPLHPSVLRCSCEQSILYVSG
ncbi:hypothetical protein BVRB_9g210030 [Beta vulgaris subsp. vulgaris]|nr:hypothetical protein BVRB_9g210030 [Beta vulgaris subsp. vulgaris]